ncbi:MAG: stalk domain-containing protein [Acidobacteriota bacterium]
MKRLLYVLILTAMILVIGAVPVLADGLKAVPLYYVYNWSGTGPVYTTSLQERDNLVAQGWKCKDPDMFVSPVQVPNTVPLYRLYTAKYYGDHFYTIDKAARDAAIKNGGYTDEGICCYVVPPTGNAAGTLQINQYKETYKGFHLYFVNGSNVNANIQYEFAAFRCWQSAGEVASINIKSPNGGESWPVGSKKTITWSTSGSGGYVNILCSTNGGTNWTALNAVAVDNKGSWPVAMPSTASDHALIKLIWINSFLAPTTTWSTDTSDGEFKLTKLTLFPGLSKQVAIGIPPAAPTGLSANALTSTNVKLAWTDASNNETGFKIERKGSGMFAQIAVTGGGATSYSDTGLTANNTYTYRVEAYNSFGESAYCSEVTVTTPPELGQPPQQPPQNNPPAKTVIQLYLGKMLYYVNGNGLNMDAAPIAKWGRTLLPIKYVGDALGATVQWDPSDKKATISLNGNTVEVWVGKNAARVNGAYKIIDEQNPEVLPVIVPPGRTLLPLRFIAENLGCDVQWDPGLQMATVTYPKP